MVKPSIIITQNNTKAIIMKHDKRLLVPRNHLVALAKFRKAGSHKKTNKQLRAKAKREMDMGGIT